MDVTPNAVSDPYLVLGVSMDANRAEIVHAFRQRVRELHPDTGVADPEGRLRTVIAAYGVLSDPSRRAALDRSRRRPRVRPQPARPTPSPPPAARPRLAPQVDDPPLRIGPVRVEPAHDPSDPSDPFVDAATLARLIARRFRSGGRPW